MIGKMLTALLLLATMLFAASYITVPPMYGWFVVAHLPVKGPGYVVVVGGDYEQHNITLFTEEGFERWMNHTPGTAVYNGVVRRGDVLIIDTPPGDYVLAVYPVDFSSETQTYITTIRDWAPVGVMSLPRWPVGASAVAGYFEIRRLKARGVAPSGEKAVNGSTIQLNAVVTLDLADGQRQYYFVQNVLSLLTDEERYSFTLNIYNNTSQDIGLSDGAIKGKGKIYSSMSVPLWCNGWTCRSVSALASYYGYATEKEHYNLPFSGMLLINASAVGGVARIDFGYNAGGGVVWHDSVTIRPYAPVERAYIVFGAAPTPVHTLMSLELVLCGYGAVPDFTGIGTSSETYRARLEDVDVDLALLVWNGTAWRPPPSIYNFGLNTGEEVTLDVDAQLVNGTVRITKGTFKPRLLAEEPPPPEIHIAARPSALQMGVYLLIAVFLLAVVLAVRRMRRRSRRLYRGGRLYGGRYL
jgi:hypothetical protein